MRTTPLASAIVQCVFDPPLLLSPKLKIVPGVVDSYRWLDGDARHLELNFRDDVLFHNGDRLTAADFKFTYSDRVQKDPTLETAPVWRHMIESVDLPSPLRAIVNFRAPMPTAPNQFAEMAACILPKAYFAAQGEAGFVARPVGSGPYRLIDYHRDSRIVLEAFDRYWAGPARIKRVTFQVMADATARSSAMQAGQADITINLSVRETQRLNTVPGLVGEIRPTTSIYFVHIPILRPSPTAISGWRRIMRSIKRPCRGRFSAVRRCRSRCCRRRAPGLCAGFSISL